MEQIFEFVMNNKTSIIGATVYEKYFTTNEINSSINYTSDWRDNQKNPIVQ